jgi:membrane fusion protein, multidrug efflux system
MKLAATLRTRFLGVNPMTLNSRALLRAALLLTGSALMAACGKDASQSTGAPLPVATRQVQIQAVPFSVETVGRTEGSKEVELRARVSGILERRVYEEGSVVKAGAVLFRIDPVPFQIALDQARAALAEEQARNAQARRNAERIKELMAQNLVSRNDADSAISAMEASDAAMLRAQANVRQAELNLSYTSVTAPIGGIAGRALHSDGSLVTAGTESGLLTTVTQAQPIWARFALSTREFDALRAATESTTTLAVELVLRDGSAYPHTGRVNFAGSTVDASLGTVQLRAEFPNPDLALLPGEYVRVRVTGGAQNAVTVPQTAVLQGQKGPFVWIVNADGQAEQRIVKTGAWLDEEWRIDEGLQAGETVILDNLLKLRQGQVVNAQSPQAPPAGD